MTDLPILPAVPLSPEQAHGFRIACACISSWGRQMAEAPTLAGCDDGNTRAAGIIMGAAARALASQLAALRPEEARVVSLPVIPI